MGNSANIFEKYQLELEGLEEKYNNYIKAHPHQGCTHEIEKLFVLHRLKSILTKDTTVDVKTTQHTRHNLLAGINPQVYPKAFHRAYGFFRNSFERFAEKIYADPELAFNDWWQEKELQKIDEAEKNLYQVEIGLFRREKGNTPVQKNPQNEGHSLWWYLRCWR